MTSNNRTSHLVASQLPDFIRQDHELFIKFMEYYYEFMEQSNGVINIAKSASDYADIDIARGNNDVYLEKMYNDFISMLPEGTIADKNLILKNVKDFYRSRGTEKSVRFLTRILYNKRPEFYYPKRDILKVSDGKWYVAKSLKVNDITVDGLANDAAFMLFANSTIYGNTTNARAVVESVDRYYDRGEEIFELILSNIQKEFENGEEVFCYFTDEGNTKKLAANLFGGVVTSVTLTAAGSGYEEGDVIPVISQYPGTGSGAQVVVSKASEGSLKSIGVSIAGAGFRVNDSISFIGGGGTGAKANVLTINATGAVHPNSYNVCANTLGAEWNTSIGNSATSPYESFAYQNLAIQYQNTSNLRINCGTGGAVTLLNLSFWKANSNVYFETYDSINVNNAVTVLVTSSNSRTNTITVSPGLTGPLSNVSLKVIKRANANTSLINAVSFWAFSNTGPVATCLLINTGNNYTSPPALDISSNTAIRSLGILGSLEIVTGGLNYTTGEI